MLHLLGLVALVWASVQDIHARNEVVFVGTVSVSSGKGGQSWTASIAQTIKGCIANKVKSVPLIPDPTCLPTTGQTYLLTGTAQGKNKSMKVKLTCDTLVASTVSALDFFWLSRQVDQCGKKASCPGGASPLSCNSTTVCTPTALARCPSAATCSPNPCSGCAPMFFNKKKQRVCVELDTCPASTANACGAKATQLKDCPTSKAKLATQCVTDCRGRPVWTTQFGAAVCPEVTSYGRCVDVSGVSFQSGKGKGGSLGWGVQGVACKAISGTSASGLALFPTEADCKAACLPANTPTANATIAPANATIVPAGDFRSPCSPGGQCCPDGKAPYSCDLSAIQVICQNLDCGGKTPNYCIPDPCSNCELSYFDAQDAPLQCTFVAPRIECATPDGKTAPLSCTNQPQCGPRPSRCPASLKLTCIVGCDCTSMWVTEDNRDAPEACAAQLVDLIVQTFKPCGKNDPPATCCPDGSKKSDCKGTNSDWTCHNMVCAGKTIKQCAADPCNECNVIALDDTGSKIDAARECTLAAAQPLTCPYLPAPDCRNVNASCGAWPASCPSDWNLQCVVDPCTCLPVWLDNDVRYASLSCQLDSAPKCVTALGKQCPPLTCPPAPAEATLPDWVKQVGLACVQHPCTCIPFWQPKAPPPQPAGAPGVGGPLSPANPLPGPAANPLSGPAGKGGAASPATARPGRR